MSAATPQLLVLEVSVITSAVAMRVFDGHAVGEHRRAAEPVAVDDGHLRAELGGHQRRLVAAGSAADDHDPVTPALSPYACTAPAPAAPTLSPMSLYAAYGGNLDARLMARRAPHSPLRGTGWLNGWRLTFGGEDMGWEGALATIVEAPRSPGLRRAVRHRPRTRSAWTAGRASASTYTAGCGCACTPWRARAAWVYVLNGYEGGLPSARYLGVIADAAESAGAPHDYVAELRVRPCTSVGPGSGPDSGDERSGD